MEKQNSGEKKNPKKGSFSEKGVFKNKKNVRKRGGGQGLSVLCGEKRPVSWG